MKITWYSLLLLALYQTNYPPAYAVKNEEGDSSPAANSTKDADNVYETELKFRARSSVDPSSKHQARKDLLRFYQSKHNRYAANDTFRSLTDPLHQSLRRVIQTELEEAERQQSSGQSQSDSPNPQFLQYQREIQEAQEREQRALRRAAAEEDARKSAQEAQDLSDAAAAAIQLSKLNQDWADYLRSEGSEQEAANYARRARKYAITGSGLLAKEGIAFYRANRLPDALQKFRDAEEAAPPNSHQQLAAANNTVFALEKMGSNPELWNAKHHAFVLRFKVEGTPIPEDFDGDTPDLALESKLIKHNQLDDLLRFYQERHQFDKAKNVFGKILDGIPWTDEMKVQRHLNWAKYCDSEGQTSDAIEHRNLADLLQKRQAAWQKEEFIRKKREEAEAAKLAEKQRKEQEEEFARQQSAAAAEQARKDAMSAEEKAKAEEAKRRAEERLKQPPDLIGKKFTSDYGGALDFVDHDNVDIHTALQELKRTGRYTSDFTNFGDLPDIMPANYKIVGSAPHWTIRIQSILKGSPRIDNYSFLVDEDGSIKLVGGATPLPTVLRGGKAF